MDDTSDKKNDPPKAGDIVRSIINGDKSAEAELVRALQAQLLFIVRRKFPGKSFHEDIVQDAFVVALAAIRDGRVENPDSIEAFLRTTTYHIGYEYLRNEKKHRPVIDSSQVDDISDSSADVYKNVEAYDRVRLVRQVIEEMPVERDREMLIRFYFLNEGKETICHDLGISSTHFDRVIYRAKQRLKSLVEKRLNGDPPRGSPQRGNENGPGSNDCPGDESQKRTIIRIPGAITLGPVRIRLIEGIMP